jgi:hypothetical protein
MQRYISLGNDPFEDLENEIKEVEYQLNLAKQNKKPTKAKQCEENLKILYERRPL